MRPCKLPGVPACLVSSYVFIAHGISWPGLPTVYKCVYPPLSFVTHRACLRRRTHRYGHWLYWMYIILYMGVGGSSSLIRGTHVVIRYSLPHAGILVRKNGIVQALTTNHDTLNENEFERVRRCGGFYREQVRRRNKSGHLGGIFCIHGSAYY